MLRRVLQNHSKQKPLTCILIPHPFFFPSLSLCLFSTPTQINSLHNLTTLLSRMRSDTTMNNTLFSNLITKEDQENMASRGRRIHALSKKTNNKANNGPTQRVMLHGSAEKVASMKEYVCEAELVSSSALQQKVVVESGRERLKRHREEMGGHVSIPDKWGQEELLKDWIDCSSFEALLVPNKIASARKALVADHGRSGAASHQLRIESRC